jgi:hypothetical protein
MSLNPDLSSSRAKAKRASEHLETLYELVREYAASGEPYKLISEFNAQTGWLEVRGRARPAEPILSVILGELLHDLRSGLDHAVSALVVASGGQVSKQHQFPICSTPEKFISAAGPAKKPAGALAGIHAGYTVIEWYQPYHTSAGAIGALGLLQRLSNSDKHRRLVDYAPMPFSSVTKITSDRPVVEDWKPPGGIQFDFHDEFVIERFRFDPPYPTNIVPSLELAVQMTFLDAALPPDYQTDALFSLEQLRAVRDEVNVILDQLEAV